MQEKEAVEIIGKIHGALLELTDVVNFLSKEWSRPRMQWSTGPAATTAGLTTTAPTSGNLSGVGETMAFMTPTTPPSSQSDTKTEDAGPVEQDSGCAHWMWDMEAAAENHRVLWVCGSRCGAYKWLGKILVPAAGPDTSTSQKQPSNSSSETSVGESVPSPSSALIESWWPNGWWPDVKTKTAAGKASTESASPTSSTPPSISTSPLESGVTTEAGETGQDVCKHWHLEDTSGRGWSDGVLTSVGMRCLDCRRVLFFRREPLVS